MAALTGFYLMGAVLLAGSAFAHAPSPAAVSKPAMTASTPAVVPSDNATGNNTSGENDQGDNSTGGDDQGDNGTSENDQGDQGNSTVCSGSGDNNSQGDQGSGNTTSGDLPATYVVPAEDNGTGNETGDNETGDSGGNETGDSGGNDTGGAPSGNCSGGDPPVTFKALGLPSGSTWSVTAGNPAVTLTNTTVGHRGLLVFNVTNGTLNFSIQPPAGFGVQKVVGPGNPSQTSVNISGPTVLTVKFSAFQTLTFVEKGLPAGSVWAVKIWSSLPHGGPTSQSGSNTTTASGGAIVFSVVKGSWKFNVTEVPANFTAHPSHGSVGVAGHPVNRNLRFHPMMAPPAAPVGAPAMLAAVLTRLSAV